MEFTSLWIAWQRYKANIGLFTATAVALLIGIYIGQTMSPLTAATPIIFTDVPREDISQSIESVKLSGVALRPVSSKQPSVAAATTSPNTNGSGDYIASKNSNLYHHTSCAAAKRILPANARFFKTPQEAEGVGLTPSKCTLDLKNN